MGPTLSNNDRVDCWFFLSELNSALSQLRANLLPSQYLLLFWLRLTNTESETSRLVYEFAQMQAQLRICTQYMTQLLGTAAD